MGEHKRIVNRMTQTKRLDYLIDAFKADSNEYKDAAAPQDLKGKRRLLRSLMNLRPPRPLADEVLQMQDEYLKERAVERGIVDAALLPAARAENGADFCVWQGDITLLRCDAIVNAANSQMLGCFAPCHACIDNCIHTYAGVQLRAECNAKMESLKAKHGRQYEMPTSEPIITKGYNLPARYVIHVAGPIVNGPLTASHEGLLALCYTRVLDLCLENSIKSAAFCCISTGVFRFPNRRAAEIAVKSTREWLACHVGAIKRVIFNVFKDEDKKIYSQLLG